jgi:hypothetical protein
MAVTLFVAYEQGSEINVDYYVNKHLPLALKAWAKVGVAGYKLDTTKTETSPFEVLLAVHFESMAGVGKLQTEVTPEDNKALQDDLANYSKKPPKIWVMETAKSSL